MTDPPEAVLGGGEIEVFVFPAWVAVIGFPATVRVPVRPDVPVFGGTLTKISSTLPFQIVIGLGSQSALLVTVLFHAQVATSGVTAT